MTVTRKRGESFVDHLVRVAEALAVARDGTPFSLDERRAWVRSVWSAVTGVRCWPIPERQVDPGELCDACRARAGRVVEWSWEIDGVARAEVGSDGEIEWIADASHVASGCVGVGLYPITFVWLNLPRQEGKTFQAGVLCNVLALTLENFRASFLSNSEDQSEALWSENFAPFVERNAEDLEGIATIGRTSIRYRETLFGAESSSAIDFMTASASSGTGRTKRDLVVIDECRDIAHELVTKVAPAITSTKGLRCPHGHVRHLWTGRELPTACGVCAERLVPYWGRLMLMSSAGARVGGDADWFADGLDALAEQPSRYAWTHVDRESTNPIVSQATRGALAEVFGRVPQMRLAVDVEIHNRAVSKGADFISIRHVERASCARQEDGSVRPCVGFLDPSATDELTTLVILEDVGLEAGEQPWTWLRQARLDIWAPNPRRLVRPSDDRAYLRDVRAGQVDEAVVREWLEILLPRFPGLRSLGVDTRGMAWASRLVEWARTSRTSWGRAFASIRRHDHDRDVAFSELENRVIARGEARGFEPGVRGLEMIGAAQLFAEFKGARRKATHDGRSKVTDASRYVRHLDVVDALAMACWEAHKLAILPRAGGLSDLMRGEAKRGSLLARLRPMSSGLGQW